MSDLDKELERIINHAIVRDSKEENPLAVDDEAVKLIKQAIAMHVIGEDTNAIERDSYGRVTKYDETAEHQNELRKAQRQSLWSKD